MKLHGLIPVLSCNHLQQTMEFYQQAFRYIVINKTESDAGLEWVHLKSDNTYIMLQQQADHTSANRNNSAEKKDNILLYYYTDDVEAQYQLMLARGMNPGDISLTEYGMKEFFLDDPEGNRLAVGQRMGKN
ncbi:MAG: hypothetical protein OQL06_14335 [Gammaproteobacteria bacterium]|nr:hypothetical protein [Gammaproteobacteria bacterium]